MSRIPSIAISTGLIGAGALAWTLTARPLASDPDLAVPLNPMGVNGSPYGQVFAMALQGPIDTNFHVGLFGAQCECSDPEHDHNKNFSKPGSLILRQPEAKPEAKPAPRSLQGHLRHTISVMEKASKARTNPKPPSDALKFYLRRQAEDKLRFGYRLDPSHYANYNALHFFLTEGVGTRPELTPSAAKLAEDTVRYCLKQEHDPRPALTAAAACTNILHLMFADARESQPKFSTSQMRQTLAVLDQCIARYVTLAQEWDQNGNWELLSAQRIDDCETRFNFICKVRDAADKTIDRLEGNTPPQQASS